MRKARNLFVLLVLSIALLADVTVAAAASGWKSVDVTVLSENQQGLLLVAGELPEDTKLPYKGELAVPAGTEIQWAGEILGGGPENDVELKYVKSSADGHDIYRFTMTKSLIAQIEGAVPTPVTFDGTNYTSGFTWTAWQDTPEVRINQRIPQGSKIVAVDAEATLKPGDGGYSYYTKTVTDVKAGDTIDLKFTYALPTGGVASTGKTASSGNSPAVLVIFAVFAGIVALVAYNVNRKMALKRAEETADAPASVGSSARTSGKGEPIAELADEDEVQAPAGRRSKSLVPILIVVAAFAVAFIFAATRGTSAAVVDGKIAKNFGSQSACQFSSIPVIPNEGVDLARQGEELVNAFDGASGVGDVVLDVEQSRIDIGWCESSQSEESVRQALMSTGLVTLGASSSGPASAPASTTAP